MGRKFISTAERRIGLGTADTRIGDLICIFNGANAAYVLRKLDHGRVLNSSVHSQEDLEEHSELFSLMGDAYINGSMHGEAFTAPGRGPERVFVLA